MTRVDVAGVQVTIDDAEILRGCDLIVEPHEVVALVGPNGSGKSSIMRALEAWIRQFDGVSGFESADVRIGAERFDLQLTNAVDGESFLWGARSYNAHTFGVQERLTTPERSTHGEERFNALARAIGATRKAVARPRVEPIDDPKRIDFDPFPWHSMGVWILTQMKRWGYIKGDIDYKAIAEQVYLTGDCGKIMKDLGMDVPTETYKSYTIMGKVFDPEKAEEYAKSFPIGRA